MLFLINIMLDVFLALIRADIKSWNPRWILAGRTEAKQPKIGYPASGILRINTEQHRVLRDRSMLHAPL